MSTRSDTVSEVGECSVMLWMKPIIVAIQGQSAVAANEFVEKFLCQTSKGIRVTVMKPPNVVTLADIARDFCSPEFSVWIIHSITFFGNLVWAIYYMLPWDEHPLIKKVIDCAATPRPALLLALFLPSAGHILFSLWNRDNAATVQEDPVLVVVRLNADTTNVHPVLLNKPDDRRSDFSPELARSEKDTGPIIEFEFCPSFLVCR